MHNRLEMLRIFCAAAETSSFKEAAARLGISPQAVTRAVQELERSVGDVLFHRNTRGNHITAFGEQLAQRARSSVRELDALFQRNGTVEDEDIEGLVRITAPSALGHTFLLPLLSSLGRQYPGLRLDLRLSDQISDVVDEQIDIGIRLGFLHDSRFIARAVSHLHFHIVGTPELIARCGKPETLDDLAQIPCTALIDHKTGRPWPWYLANGQHWTPRNPVFATDDASTEFQAVRAGLGVGQIAAFLTIPSLRDKTLVPLLSDLAPSPWEIYVYRPQRGPVAPRIRLVFDQLVALFGDPLRFPITA